MCCYGWRFTYLNSGPVWNTQKHTGSQCTEIHEERKQRGERQKKQRVSEEETEAEEFLDTQYIVLYIQDVHIVL